MALAPDFAQSRRVWLSYAESDASGKAGTAVGYGQLSQDATQLTNFTVVFRQQPKLSVGNHFGGRLVFDGPVSGLKADGRDLDAHFHELTT